MPRYRRLFCAAAILLAAGLVLLVVTELGAHRSPLSVGASANEAWTYIHTPSAWTTHSALFEVARGGWKAQALDIQGDVSYSLHLKTNHLFATRHVVYVLSTNGIIATRSKWKWIRLF